MEMDKEKEIPRRKELRIKQYDYSSTGAYFITICIKDRKQILSDIIKPVGVGALDDPKIRLTAIGKIAEKNLLSSENISGVKIDRYVIMPDHIHAIILLDSDKYAGVSKGSSRTPVPTNVERANSACSQFVSTFKRFCNKEYGENIWQARFNDHIIRNRDDYEEHVKYIYENPMRWYYDELFSEE